MANDALIFEKLQTVIRERYPDFQIRYKAESVVQHIVAVAIVLFNPAYMTGFVTTWGRTVWFPSREWVASSPRRAWVLLAHEYVHIHDRARDGWRFSARQAWPQALALLAALAPLAVLWRPAAAAVLALLFLRVHNDRRLAYEVRGHAANFAADWWTGHSVTYNEVQQYARWLASSEYMWAAKNDKLAATRLGVALQAVHDGGIADWPNAEAFLDLAEAIARANAMVRPLKVDRGIRRVL